MSKLTIQFKRDVEVDLNAYYPNFPRKLRDAIDDALFAALGGVARERGEGIRVGTELWLNPQLPSRFKNSKTAAIAATLKRHYQGEKFTLEQFAKVAAEHGVEGKEVSKWAHNMARGGWLKTL
jgi:hypothetical protein